MTITSEEVTKALDGSLSWGVPENCDADAKVLFAHSGIADFLTTLIVRGVGIGADKLLYAAFSGGFFVGRRLEKDRLSVGEGEE